MFLSVMFLSVTLLSVMFPVMSLSVFHALSGKPPDQSGAGRIIEVGESCHHLFCCSHTGPAAAALWLGSRHTKFILPAIAVPVMKFMAFYLLPFPEIGKAAVGPQGYVSKPAGFPGPVSVALQDPCHGINRSVGSLQTVQQIDGIPPHSARMGIPDAAAAATESRMVLFAARASPWFSG